MNKVKKINIVKFLSVASVVSLTPGITFAASCYADYNAAGKKLGDLLDYVTCTINSSVIPLIFALATVIFIWGVVQYVINSDEEAKKEKGRQFMIWGIIGLAVMISVWSLVGILSNTVTGKNINVLPQVRPPGSQGQ